MGQVAPPASDDEGLVSALAELSRLLGSRPALAGAATGSISAKSDEHLLIRASADWLRVAQRTGVASLERAGLRDLLGLDPASSQQGAKAAAERQLLAVVGPAWPGRPVVEEALLHHVMPGRFVAHLQPALANQFGCSKNGQSLLEHDLGDDVAWVELAGAGPALAGALRAALERFASVHGGEHLGAVLLQNDGILVSGRTPEELVARTDRLLDALGAVGARALGPVKVKEGDGAPPRLEGARDLVNVLGPTLRGLLSESGGPLGVVTFDDSSLVTGFFTAKGARELVMGGPLTLDQVSRCGPLPLWFEASASEPLDALAERLAEAVHGYARAHGQLPVVVLVPGLGMFASGRSWAGAEVARRVCTSVLQVLPNAAQMGGPHYVPEQLWAALREAEVADAWTAPAGGAPRLGRALGKVALVTGAAQGFGKEIAEDLVAEGAHVALADLNVAGAQNVATALEQDHGRGRAIGLEIDVTSTSSVADAVHQVVRAYGGLDLLVVNAGVLRAASVKVQTERDFDLTTAVNYKGYFICVQNVAPVLAAQHKARPDYWSDIVQVNSKSGLQGSNKNFAYAGSKFGGIGLTQSFALELIEDGVKVNSVCPGNFFDGPLWSDPDMGLFAQYLRAGKVPGAKTVEDVRRAYEDKIPMGRGCTTADVMKAIYYLVEQVYETGQALPVTGGQVMLH
ncbi:MAG: SDR family NAD(P)-dependent oxidoreductase [Acidimicrobiales bacterium]